MRDLLFTSYLFFYNLFIQNLVFRMLALELRNDLLHPLHDLHIPPPRHKHVPRHQSADWRQHNHTHGLGRS